MTIAGRPLHSAASRRIGGVCVGHAVCTPCPVARVVQPSVNAAVPRPSTSGRSARRRTQCASLARPHVYLFGMGFGGGYEEVEEDVVDYTVAKLQVGVFGKVDDFKRRLDRIASLLDTDDVDNLRELVAEVAMLLFRSSEYCAYASTAIFLTEDLAEAENKFNATSMKERAKFKGETLVNYGGRTRSDRLGPGEAGSEAEVGLDQWLCITLLVAVEGLQLKLPKIRGTQDLSEALSMLGGLGVDDIIAAELLWTPQAEGDAYSKEELLADYPLLANV